MKKDLEDYRQHEMSSFQKVNHFFINFIGDPVSYYINGKRPYQLEDAFEKSATRDFLLRQIKIQTEDYIYPECKDRIRKGEIDTLE